MITTCLYCKKEFNISKHMIDKGSGKFCSRLCYSAFCKDKNQRICKVCGKIFYSNLWQTEHGYGIYCSHKCHGKDQGGKITMTCQHCGKEFEMQKCWMKRDTGAGRFCSQKCKWEHNKTGEYRFCKVCGKKYYIIPAYMKKGAGLYCSLDCAYKDRYTGKITNCVVCGKEYYVTKNTLQKGWGNCCSKKCRGVTTSGINNPMCDKEYFFKHGKLKQYGRYCPKFDNKRKRAVREFFGGFCICSGEHQNDIRYAFGVHHIDHDKEQGCNGKPFNLVPMNRSHHGFEGHHQEEYKAYINKTLREGFKWGIWNEQEYKEKVMYDE